MARRFLSAIKLLTGSTPPAGTVGDTFFDTDTKTIQVHDGTDWVNSSVRPTDGVAGGRVFTGDTTPSAPVTGDLWVDSDTASAANGSFTRWQISATAGQTTLSGNDINGIALSYVAGYEQVYINGALQYRGSDYTATTGSTVTGIPDLLAGDVVEVLSLTSIVLPAYTSYSSSAPVAPAVGQLWVDTGVVVPGLDSSQFLRWRKTLAGGETALSGLSDNALSLLYTPNYEQVYLNGVLLVRGVDYFATTGNTIIGLSNLVSGDVIEVFSIVALTVADVYTQSQADAKYVNKNVGGLNLVIPTGAVNGTVGTNGAVTIGNAVGSVTVQGAFSAAYDNYKIILNGGASSAQTNLIYQNGAVNTTSNYYGGLYGTNFSTGAFVSAAVNAGTGFTHAGGCDIGTVSFCAEVQNPFLPKYTTFTSAPVVYGSVRGAFSGDHEQGVSYTSFSLIPNSGTLTGGTIRIYGYNNGA